MVNFGIDFAPEIPDRNMGEQHAKRRAGPQDQYPLFVILELFGDYYFAPSFGPFDFFVLNPDDQEQVLPLYRKSSGRMSPVR